MLRSTIIVALFVLVIHVLNFATLSQAQIQSLRKQTNGDIDKHTQKMSMRKLQKPFVSCGIMISTPTAPLNGFSASVTFSYYQNEPYYPSDDFGRLLESACKFAITEVLGTEAFRNHLSKVLRYQVDFGEVEVSIGFSNKAAVLEGPFSVKVIGEYITPSLSYTECVLAEHPNLDEEVLDYMLKYLDKTSVVLDMQYSIDSYIFEHIQDSVLEILPVKVL